MDKIFTPEKYVEIDNLTIEFALGLWKDGEQPAATQDIEFIEIPGSQSQTEAEKKGESDDEEDDYFNYIVKKANTTAPKNVGSDVSVALDSKKKMITVELAQFQEYCKQFDLPLVLEDFGTDEYKKRLNRRDNMEENFTKKKSSYFCELFNCFKWWKEIGCDRFSNQYLAALIFLAS